MNYERRKIRPQQPAIPSAPHQGTTGNDSKSNQFSGCVGNGSKSDGAHNACGQTTKQKS